MQELSERVLGVFQEQTVVAEWRHGNWHLSQVVQVLQNRALREHGVHKDKYHCGTRHRLLLYCILVQFKSSLVEEKE